MREWESILMYARIVARIWIRESGATARSDGQNRKRQISGGKIYAQKVYIVIVIILYFHVYNNINIYYYCLRKVFGMSKQVENLKAELLKIGINTEQDLRDAIAALPPLKLGIMTGVIKDAVARGCPRCSGTDKEERA